MGKPTFYTPAFCRERRPNTVRLLKLYRAPRSNFRALGGGEPWRKGMREKETPQEWQSTEQKPVRGVKVRGKRQSRESTGPFSVAHLMTSAGCEMQVCVMICVWTRRNGQAQVHSGGSQPFLWSEELASKLINPLFPPGLGEWEVGDLDAWPSATEHFLTSDTICIDEILHASWQNGVISVRRVTHCHAGGKLLLTGSQKRQVSTKG